ncbi:MAG TPA: hypothetical protein VEL31_18535, partial [Ktedonobacteraceae bacterium]|nr:hypothetical protein [Ktedonobacteraceae bacterium]
EKRSPTILCLLLLRLPPSLDDVLPSILGEVTLPKPLFSPGKKMNCTPVQPAAFSIKQNVI